jgi:phosphoribosylformimino-5-aminoimidazole carboxamide ribotide isomerase
MDLILAIDLKGGVVVHGSAGERSRYAPLTWGLASSAVPLAYVSELSPKYIYIADLDRIERQNGNLSHIASCARLVDRCYVDRGCRSPSEYLDMEHVVNVVGTETAGEDLSIYEGGYLSIDIRDGSVIPNGEDLLEILEKAENWAFDGVIILNLGSVGTGAGIRSLPIEAIRSAYSGTLLFGGGVASTTDLQDLASAGYDGAIVATAVHRGAIPLSWMRRGRLC